MAHIKLPSLKGLWLTIGKEISHDSFLKKYISAYYFHVLQKKLINETSNAFADRLTSLQYTYRLISPVSKKKIASHHIRFFHTLLILIFKTNEAK